MLSAAQRARGAIFCLVISRNAVQNGSRPATVGNQKCAGALPSLIISPPIMSIVVAGLEGVSRVVRVVIIGAVRNRIEPVTWAIKYVAAAFALFLVMGVVINGIKLIRLISSPIHAIGQDEAETLIRIPRVINIRKNALAGRRHHDITYNEKVHNATLKGWSVKVTPYMLWHPGRPTF